MAHCLIFEDKSTLVTRYTRAHLVRLRGELEKAQASPHTIKGWWSEWRRAIRRACQDLGVPDPGAGLEGPEPLSSAAPRREQRTLGRAEVLAVIDHVEVASITSDYGICVAILGLTGMRLGEALALEWSSVDFVAGIVEVRASAHWTPGAGWSQTSPKSGRVRRVGLAPHLAELLRKAQGRQRRAGRLPVGRVCQSAQGGYLQTTRVRSRLAAASKALDLDVVVTPQVLRRTWNTLALAVMDRVVVQAQIGHADDAMTAHYLGVRDETLREVSGRMWE